MCFKGLVISKFGKLKYLSVFPHFPLALLTCRANIANLAVSHVTLTTCASCVYTNQETGLQLLLSKKYLYCYNNNNNNNNHIINVLLIIKQ